MKRAGGRRFYRPSDIAVLRGVRRLLHEDGYTIKGVQRVHREHGSRHLIAAGEGARVEPESSSRDRLVASLTELEALKQRLDALLRG
jgi:DNA-binding transcriptional MerR regulator